MTTRPSSDRVGPPPKRLHRDRVRDRLHWLANTAADTPFLIEYGPAGGRRTWTYGEIDALTSRVASMLRFLGVHKGDAVNVHLPNCWQFVVAFFAGAELGARVVPTNTHLTVDEIAFIASQARCRVSITDQAGLLTVNQARTDMAPDIETVLVTGDAAPDGDEISFDTELWRHTGQPGRSWSRASDTVAVLYTAGTSGWPKGIRLTNANLVFAGESTASLVRLRSDDRWLIELPLYHMNALGYSLMSAVASGASVTVGASLAPTEFWRRLQHSESTITSLFAHQIRNFLAAADSPVDSRLRLTMYAQRISAERRGQLERITRARAMHIYGLTETLAPTLAEPFSGPALPASLGIPTPWVEVRVVDPSGRPSPFGEIGELEVRGVPGVSLSAGYLHEAENSDSSEVWFRTGDRVSQDPQGNFDFYGRQSDLLKPAVENVSTVEIERVLQEHIAVADAAVVGVTTDTSSESIVAFVVVRPGEEDTSVAELAEWVDTRLSRFKQPDRIVFIDQLPRSQVGKVLKGELRALAE